MSDIIMFNCPSCGLAMSIPTSTTFADAPAACIAAHDVLKPRERDCDGARMAGAAAAAVVRDRLKIREGR